MKPIKPMTYTRQIFAVAALASLVFAAGCQSMSPSMPASPFAKKASRESKNAESDIDYQQPVRMAVIWKESSVTAPGKKPTRGFGGRVYFYDEKNETVRVDGELMVYAYDDSNTSDDQKRVPDRKYVFRASDLQKHYSKTGLGESYSIWLPWDKIGGHRKTIALVPVFKPVDGMIPDSDHSIAVLSGTNPDPNLEIDEEMTADSRVRQVSMSVPGNQRPDAATIGTDLNEAITGTVRTSTFDVPRTLANRIKNSPKPAPRRKLIGNNRERTNVDGTNSGHQQKTYSESPNVASPIETASEISPGGRAPRKFGQPGSFR